MSVWIEDLKARTRQASTAWPNDSTAKATGLKTASTGAVIVERPAWIGVATVSQHGETVAVMASKTGSIDVVIGLIGVSTTAVTEHIAG